MLKATATKEDGRTLVIIGLSHANLDRLKQDMPIPINGKEMALDCDILIFAEPTEQDMLNRMKDLIGPETMVTIDPKLKTGG